MKVKINKKKDEDLSDFSKKLIQNYYLRDEKSAQEGFARAATAYCFSDYDLAQRIYNYVSNGWFMYASPVLSNAPTVKWPTDLTWKQSAKWLKDNIKDIKLVGLPISCFLSYCPDSLEGLIEHEKELRWLSVNGGGVGSHFADVRSIGQATSKGAKTPGIMPFMHCIDSSMLAYHQGQTRRGNAAVYLDVYHPEVLEFLEMRLPRGDVNRQNLNLHHGINISNEFIQFVMSGKDWELIDPNSGNVTKTLPARDLWKKILDTRFRTGEPYLNFIDTAYEALHPRLKRYGLNGSNLCNEIHLPTTAERTAVCCLSSVNLERYDEWKDTDMVKDLIRYLDNVTEFFITAAPDTLSRAKHSASMERSLGLGAMGFHSYLQSKMVPFESAMASSINREIFSRIKEQAYEATVQLAKERGTPYDLAGECERNAHLLAIAPNSNSSLILGCSPSIEPWKANVIEKSTRAGSTTVRNAYLGNHLHDLGLDNDAVWRDIMANNGSVADVPGVDHDVFRTANEMDQHWIVEHASVRQEWICQGQSLNLFFPKGSDINYVNSVHLKAATSNVKGLYYLRTDGQPVEDISKQVQRVRLPDSEDCLACEG